MSKSPTIRVVVFDRNSDPEFFAVEELYRLASPHREPEWDLYIRFISQTGVFLICAYDQDAVKKSLPPDAVRKPIDYGVHQPVGMTTLDVRVYPNRVIARVEDVFVLPEYRGKGVGSKIMRTLLTTAEHYSVDVLELTSRPSRTHAHGLYQKFGFVQRETNVFRLELKTEQSSR